MAPAYGNRSDNHWAALYASPSRIHMPAGGAVRSISVRKAVDAGIALAPEDRQSHGLGESGRQSVHRRTVDPNDGNAALAKRGHFERHDALQCHTTNLKPTPLNRTELNRLMTTTSFNATLGFKVVRVWKDGITMEVQVRPELTNIFGSLHGGVTATLVDAAAGVALFGQLGAPGASAHDTSLECQGMAYVSKTGVATGTLMARRLQLYEGADLQGPFKTLKKGDNLPVLHDVLPDPP